MTNEQLAVVIEGIRAELLAAIDEAHVRMPDDAERTKVSVNTSGHIITFNPDDYEMVDSNDFEALVPLVDLAERLRGRIALLIGES